MVCIYSGPGCVEGSVRLVQSTNPNSGRVELCHDLSWTTVTLIGSTEANVLCRQLGLSDEGILVTVCIRFWIK